jgi:Bacterial capsule synthesis protein PGA_cap
MTLARGRLAALAAALLAGLLGLTGCSGHETPPTPAPAAVGSDQPSVPAPAGSSSAPADPNAQLTLSAVGDVMMGNAPSQLPPNNGHGFFDPVAASLHSDVQMANLEQPLTNDTGVGKCGAGSAGKSCFQFRSPPSYAAILKEAGFALVNLANNHAYDFGPAGHQNTRNALDAAGVKYTGPPGMITTVTVKGIRVAVLGFAPYPWANDLLNIPKAQELVRQARSQADLVIIQVHMGGEGADHTHVKPGTEIFFGENRGDPIAFSHAVIDAGADLVIGHSPHVLRAMEFYKGKLIAYSLGNFAGYHTLGTGGVVGISEILRVTLRKDGTYVSGTLVPAQMVAPGVPRLDPRKQAISLVSSLTTVDFPHTGARIGADGAVTPAS